MNQPKQFENVVVDTKANIYFEGKVVSHSIWFADGSKKTLGLIYPGKYHFNTDAAEIMDMISGDCLVKIAGTDETKTYTAGSGFQVPANSSFDIEVKQGIAEYICSFVK